MGIYDFPQADRLDFTRVGGDMRTLRQLACAAYVTVLTILLLVPNPAALVGMHAAPVFPWGKFGIHLTAFVLLTLSVHIVRWPAAIGWPLLPLLIYAGGTEALQMFVPQRHARVTDFLENSLGILVGATLYWLFQRVTQHRAGRGDFARGLIP